MNADPAPSAEPLDPRRPRRVPVLLLVLALGLAAQCGVQAGAVAEPAGSRASASRTAPRWQWPLRPRPRVVGAFRAPEKRWLAGHRGVDLASSPGQEIASPEAGTVSFSGRVVDRAVVTVSTTDGRKVSFEPVEDPLPQGTAVRRGQRIAVRDRTLRHEPCGWCLHWGVREGTEYVNPLKFVGALGPSVLLPVPVGRAPRAAPSRTSTTGRTAEGVGDAGLEPATKEV